MTTFDLCPEQPLTDTDTLACCAFAAVIRAFARDLGCDMGGTRGYECSIDTARAMAREILADFAVDTRA